MAYFPLFIDLEGRNCLIVGGGMVAYRKVMVLKDFGADIRVIAPNMTPILEGNYPSVRLIYREFEEQDLVGTELVVAATADEMLNRRISQLCRRERIPVNVVDVQEECSFIFPALIREKDITVGISTGGSSPTIAQYLKKQFKEQIPKGFGDLSVQLGSYRYMVKAQVDSQILRAEIFKEMVELGVKSGCMLTEQQVQELINNKQEAGADS